MERRAGGQQLTSEMVVVVACESPAKKHQQLELGLGRHLASQQIQRLS